MKKVILEYGDILIGVTLFIMILVGISGVSYKSETERFGKIKITQLQQIKP